MAGTLKPKKRKSDILDEKELMEDDIIDPTFSKYDDDTFPEFRKSKKEKAGYTPYKTGGAKRTQKK